MQPNDAQRIRTVLALLAVKHRPKDVSFPAYVLHLRDKFPLKEDEIWRVKALKLAEEVDSLKRKYAEDRAELNILREVAVAGSDCGVLTTPQSVQGAKKRKPNHVAPNHVAPNHVAESRGAVDASIVLPVQSKTNVLGESLGITTPELSDASHLFNSYHKLSLLSSSIRTQSYHGNHDGDLLISAKAVLLGLVKALQMALCPNGSRMVSLVFINDFNLILCSTLSRVMSLLPSNGTKSGKALSLPTPLLEALETFFAILASDIILPLVKGFSRFSIDALLPDVQIARQKKQNECSLGRDTRKILHGFRMVLNGIIAIIGRNTSVHGNRFLDVMKLGIVNEIERIWVSSNETASNTTDPSSSDAISRLPTEPCLQPVVNANRQERIRRLGRKTALWYLSAVGHDTFSPAMTRPSSGDPTCLTSGMVRGRLDVELSHLLVRCSAPADLMPRRDPQGIWRICDTEKGVIMSLIEKIWLAE